MGMTLRAARINAGFTQKNAANALGVAVDTLSKYERGLSFPGVPIISKIEAVYGVEYRDLIFLSKYNGLSVKCDPPTTNAS